MWEAVGEVIKAIAPMFTAAAACTAAYIGYKGLTRWQAEMLGKRRTELAEDVLSGFYQMRDIISAIRSPMGYAGEGESRVPAPNESEETTKARNTHYVPIARFEQNREFIRDLQTKRYRMKALYGISADNAFRLMDEALNGVIVASRMLIMTADGRGRDMPEQYPEWQRAIYETGGEKDEIAKKVNEAVKLMEQVCRPILEASK